MTDLSKFEKGEQVRIFAAQIAAQALSAGVGSLAGGAAYRPTGNDVVSHAKVIEQYIKGRL